MTEDSPATPLQRRGFVKALAAAGGSVTALLATVPALRAFAAPAAAPPPREAWVNLGEADLFDTGVPVRRDFAEAANDAWVESRSIRSVWLYTADGEEFVAYNGRCTHLGCSYEYEKDQQQFHCPCHHGLFDAATGAVTGGPPPRPLDTLPVKVVDGNVFVQYQDFRIGTPEKTVA